jgi:methylase of polypeptide subunit release factors
MRYFAMPEIHWSEHDIPHTALWRSERGALPPKRIQIADDTLNADAAYRLASEGVGLLWAGDFQNARHLVQALDRRISRHAQRKKPAKTSLLEAFHLQRQAQAHRARILGSVLIHLQADHQIALRRAPDVQLACQEAWDAAFATPSAANACVCSLRELLGLISAHEWRKKGVVVPQLGMNAERQLHKIHPHYGVFSPVRGEYVELVAKAPLPQGEPSNMRAIDIGTGTGVLALLLAKRGMGQVLATDTSPRALACARDNLARLQAQGFSHAARVQLLEAHLFADETPADLIVCNPPWLPARASSALEQAVYDEDSQMLQGFLKGAASRLLAHGQAWLILSDLAEHIGLRSREQLLQAIAESGLRVIERHDTKPAHPKSRDPSDALFSARSKEVTSLWRLGKAPA